MVPAVTLPPDPQTRVPSTRVNHRFQHVDSLRAVAALLVAALHLSELFGPLSRHEPAALDFLFALPRNLSFGRVGVILFFAVSGFVIYHSLDRQGGGKLPTARRFVIKRFCRLYPAFWVSVLVGTLCWYLRGDPLTWKLVAANATMLPGFLGQPAVIGLYWTLQTELVFYALCLLLFWRNWLGKPVVLIGLIVLLPVCPRITQNLDHLLGTHLRMRGQVADFCFNLGVMFWGAYFRTVYDATAGFRQAVWRERRFLVLAALTLWISLAPEAHTLTYLLGFRPGRAPTYIVYPVSMLLFGLWVGALRVRTTALTYLGTVSYSLYLFHPVAFWLVYGVLTKTNHLETNQMPLWLLFTTGMVLSVGMAAVVYRWVEVPGMNLGERWTKEGAPPHLQGGKPLGGNLPRGQSAASTLLG